VDQRLTVKEKSQSQPGSDTMTEFGKCIFYTIVLYRDWKFINAQKIYYIFYDTRLKARIKFYP
jgi:hypothetical protein